MKKYDLVVIGGGAAGLVAAAGAASLGAQTALIDKANLGGDCLWTGCVPTKSLLHSAKLIHQAKKIKEFGLNFTGKPDFAVVQERLHKAIERIQAHDDPERFRAMGIDVYYGSAMFENSHIVSIDKKASLYGKRIVIATGSRANIPPIQGLEEAGFLTNESALEMGQLPSSILVLGGGPMGLEFAQAFARMGTKVSVVELTPDILFQEDAELVPYVRRVLEQEGIEFITGANVVEARRIGQQRKEIIIEKNRSQLKLEADEIFVAVGRRSNTESLCLANAGVETTGLSIKVNAYLQTNVRHIYAAGDVNGSYRFTHAAGYEGKMIVYNAVLGLKRKVDYRNLPWVIFTDPEVFHLGLTEQQARMQNSSVKVFRTELKEVERFITDGETEGVTKIITDAKGRILGAHAVGSHAGDFMQEVVFAKQFGHKIGSLSHVIHPYPSHTGAVQRTADLYWREKIFDGFVSRLLKTYTRWFR
jgi:pyruvate/2-oxoglutarate dehydrogenase complex dihydrolipoamide dehydrogenase (E3) component